MITIDQSTRLFMLPIVEMTIAPVPDARRVFEKLIIPGCTPSQGKKAGDHAGIAAYFLSIIPSDHAGKLATNCGSCGNNVVVNLNYDGETGLITPTVSLSKRSE